MKPRIFLNAACILALCGWVYGDEPVAEKQKEPAPAQEKDNDIGGGVQEVVKVVPLKAEPTGIKSLPNKRGDVIEIFRREDNVSSNESGTQYEVAVLRKADGQIFYLFELHAGAARPLTLQPVVQQILWLNDDDDFACVNSGRINSWFALYSVYDSDQGSRAVRADVLTSGVLHYRVTWSVRGKTLVGVDGDGDERITIADY